MTERADTLNICVDESSDIEELLASIQGLPTTIQTVEMYSKLLSVDRRVLETIGQIQSLKHISISPSFAAKFALPVSTLAAFFRGARNLQTFTMGYLELTEASSSMKELGETLRHHQCLQEFRMEHCRLNEEQNQQSTAPTTFLDPIFAALSNIPTLRMVNLASLGRIPVNPSLGALCQAPRLEELLLNHFHLSQEHMICASPAIAASTSLKGLTLSYCAITHGLDQALARMLEMNASLERFTLRLDDRNIDKRLQCALIKTARAIKSNNRTLKEFHIWGPTTKDTQQEFVNAMHLNVHLEFLWLERNRFQASVEFYTSINSVRRQLLSEGSNTTKSDWVDAIRSQRRNVSGIFVLLSSNPLMCH